MELIIKLNVNPTLSTQDMLEIMDMEIKAGLTIREHLVSTHNVSKMELVDFIAKEAIKRMALVTKEK